MKKLFTLAAACFLAAASFAGNSFKLNETAVDELFSASENITASVVDDAALSTLNTLNIAKTTAGDQTAGGYLVRAFFCGWIGLHRGYMGSNMSQMWWKYFLVNMCTGVGGLIQCVDFWWVIFNGDALDKYRNNDKFVVWLE